MQEPVTYVKVACPHCGGHIEFPAVAVGTELPCPHCATQVLLSAEGTEPPIIYPAKRARVAWWIATVAGPVGILVLLCWIAARPQASRRATDDTRQREVSGQVFISPQGGVSVKLGSVPVLVCRREALQGLLSNFATECNALEREFQNIGLRASEEAQRADKEYHMFSQEGGDVAASSAAKARMVESIKTTREVGSRLGARAAGCLRRLELLEDDLFSVKNAVLATSTDADGNFRLVLPDKANYSVAARATRLVGEETEEYWWVENIGSETTQNVLLNDLNTVNLASLKEVKKGIKRALNAVAADSAPVSNTTSLDSYPIVSQPRVGGPLQGGFSLAEVAAMIGVNLPKGESAAYYEREIRSGIEAFDPKYRLTGADEMVIANMARKLAK